MEHILNDNLVVLEYCRDRKKREIIIQALLADKDFLGKVKSFILSHNGSIADYEDSVNDGILAFVKMCMKSEFKLNSDLKAYLYGIIKNLWFSHCRREGIKLKIFNNTINEPQNILEPSVEDILIKKERKAILRELIEQLGSKCKEILTMWSYNLKMEEISNKLGLPSVVATRKAKHDCLKKIHGILASNPSLAIKLK